MIRQIVTWGAALAAPIFVYADCASLVTAARASFDRRQFEQAAAMLERAREECPKSSEILLSLAQTRVVLGQEGAAEKAFRESLEIDPAHIATLYSLGRLHYSQHRYPEAVERLKQVIALEPKHYRAHDNLGLCYDALQQDADALRHFFRALDLVMKDHRDYDWAHANLADFFLKREQYEKAFQLAAEAAKRNPASARNAFLTGKALTKLDKIELSLRWLEQAVKLDAGYAEAWYLLSQNYRRLGRAGDSAKALARFKETNRPGMQ